MNTRASGWSGSDLLGYDSGQLLGEGEHHLQGGACGFFRPRPLVENSLPRFSPGF